MPKRIVFHDSNIYRSTREDDIFNNNSNILDSDNVNHTTQEFIPIPASVQRHFENLKSVLDSHDYHAEFYKGNTLNQKKPEEHEKIEHN